MQVSSLFKDGTIGSDINIIVVSLLLLEEEPVSDTLPLFIVLQGFCVNPMIQWEFQGGNSCDIVH